MCDSMDRGMIALWLDFVLAGQTIHGNVGAVAELWPGHVVFLRLGHGAATWQRTPQHVVLCQVWLWTRHDQCTASLKDRNISFEGHYRPL